eukprot:TRINITY_DN3553_c0_g1_i1.p2 TRINITY_DN3553_c0_g1~~TRINITY_DN3553_c0_g1_i1.p2  ORF type:complete len:233 (-),score=56.04 TRINITY_DN3553_c0_g1_i1:89-787(-)
MVHDGCDSQPGETDYTYCRPISPDAMVGYFSGCNGSVPDANHGRYTRLYNKGGDDYGTMWQVVFDASDMLECHPLDKEGFTDRRECGDDSFSADFIGDIASTLYYDEECTQEAPGSVMLNTELLLFCDVGECCNSNWDVGMSRRVECDANGGYKLYRCPASSCKGTCEVTHLPSCVQLYEGMYASMPCSKPESEFSVICLAIFLVLVGLGSCSVIVVGQWSKLQLQKHHILS